MSALAPLPPGLLDTGGATRFGAWAGALDRVDWQGLIWPRRPGWLEGWLRHKRWQYVAIAHPQVFVGIAVVDLGWAAHAFAYAFLRVPRQLVSLSRDGLPGACRVDTRPFADAAATLPGLRIEMQAAPRGLRVIARHRRLQLDACLDLGAMPPPACIVAPANLIAHCTHKSGAVPLAGQLQVAGCSIDLAGAVASLDHSDGFLAHDTRWQWASAHATGFGFNLQAGYMDAAENVIWLAGVPHKLGAVRFEHDRADPLAPWQMRSDCGSTHLRFQPEGLHQGSKNLGFASSRFVQAIGTYSGRLGVPGEAGRDVSGLLGVSEDHASRW
ncbi:DUF2804 domain-containing protein [Niveibacterium sp. 24ML]|uniref:DUF2804 domain-containing protein n=1 Tax=Niveibacterium sp. 24ML TaxID=2985512 RepID=UPI00226DF5F2|nr:DUF2804 domain-containing protein [Niveibacterium sp. 24ML]MCX9156239.1 DUF2804 domain-containing protein [Niveibacterium sp. 24ML]